MEGPGQQSIDGFVRSVREGGLTRAEVLRRAAAAGFALTVPSILAACGGDSGSEGSPAAKSSEVPDKPGGLLRIALPAGVAGSLDPHAPASLHARLRNTNVFDPLFFIDNAGKLVPALAEEAPRAAEEPEGAEHEGHDREHQRLGRGSSSAITCCPTRSGRRSRCSRSPRASSSAASW
jgi:hypothetical protein